MSRTLVTALLLGYPASFAVRIVVDASNALVELDEGDDRRTECITTN